MHMKRKRNEKKIKIGICLLLLLTFCPMAAFAAPLGDTALSGNAVNSTVPFTLSNNGAYYLVETNTDTLLYSKNADQKMYPASLTKIMTAILTLEYCPDLSQKVIYTQEAYDWVEAQSEAAGGNISSAGLHLGEELTVKDLLYGCMLSSGNDAAEILAYHVGGSNTEFYNMMNAKAKELGAVNTNFCNANGLFDENHYTTAYDMYLIADYAMQNETFAEIVATKEYQSEPTNMKPNGYKWKTTIFMMDPTSEYYYSDSIHGVKTGTLLAAGRCLITVLDKNDCNYMLVLLGADIYGNNSRVASNRVDFAETEWFYDWALNNYQRVVYHEKGSTAYEADIRFAKGGQETLALTINEDCSAMFPVQSAVNMTTPKAETVVTFHEDFVNKRGSINAPVQEGDVVGTMAVLVNGEEVECVDLLAAETVERNWFAFIFFTIIESIVFKILVGLVVLVLAIRTINKIRYSRRRGLRF